MVLTAPVETPGDVKIVRPPDCCSRIRVSEMSSRLEEGWTLLNQTCPVPGCHTALLRDTRKDAHGEVRHPCILKNIYAREYVSEDSSQHGRALFSLECRYIQGLSAIHESF